MKEENNDWENDWKEEPISEIEPIIKLTQENFLAIFELVKSQCKVCIDNVCHTGNNCSREKVKKELK